MSSKYFIWDPDLPFLRLGIFSALKEVQLVQELRAQACPLLRFSYLGFYIHHNRKMRCALRSALHRLHGRAAERCRGFFCPVVAAFTRTARAGTVCLFEHDRTNSDVVVSDGCSD